MRFPILVRLHFSLLLTCYLPKKSRKPEAAGAGGILVKNSILYATPGM